MTAITTVFPNAILLGCLFHFIRALWRKADQLTIKKSKIRRAHVKRCIALAFLPKEYVQDGWLYVRGECFKEECILRFNEYFYKTWLKETSYFADKLCFFNVHHRTNNANESWNGLQIESCSFIGQIIQRRQLLFRAI